MPEWIPVVDSTRLTAIAYSEVEQRIYVRFNDGSIYGYEACSGKDWNDFTAPGTSKGAFVTRVLDKHLYRRIQ